MKAIINSRYGSPDLLELKEVDKPVPDDDEVLIRVYASSVNDWDLGFVVGPPLIMRPLFGWLEPRVRILGCDVAGVVESVGRNIERFQPGDAVYGDIHACGFGAYAEYVCVDENALEAKPSSLSFEEAAAVPHAATLAWQALYDIGQLPSRQELLINGAGGGVGPIAFHLAKLHGLEVTGVDSGDKLTLLRSMGFDHVLDYRQEDFTRSGNTYDLILDVKTHRSLFDYARALKPNGCYVTVGGSPVRLLQTQLFGGWISRTKHKDMRLLLLKPNRGLAEMAELFETGKIVPVVEGPYPLSEVPEAIRLFSKGEQKGRIVITMLGEQD